MKAKNTPLALAVALGLVFGRIAEAQEVFKIDPSRSMIAFQVHQFLGTVTGKFTQFSGAIDVDRDHPEKSSVTATIQARSIDTGIEKRDNHLRSAEFFNVEKFPEIKFKGRSVKQTGTDSGDILGDFTMHGLTRPITLHVKLLGKNEAGDKTTRWHVTTEPIKRKEFGLMWGPGVESVSMIGKDVTVNIQIEAQRVK